MAYPQGAPTPAVRTPSKTGIIWAIVIFLVTAVIGIVMIVIGAVTAVNAVGDFEGVDAGETRTLQLRDGGTYEVYAGETSGRDRLIGEMGIEIIDPDGREVRYWNNGRLTETFETGDEYYEKVGSFDVGDDSDEHPPGAYEVTVTGPPTTTARIGQVPYLKIGLLIGGGIAIGSLGFLVAAIVLIVALVRRSRAKKANQLATGGYGAPGMAPPPYGQPGYGQPGYGQPGPPPAPPQPAAPMPPPAPATPPPPPASPGGATPPPPPPPPAPPGGPTPPPPPSGPA